MYVSFTSLLRSSLSLSLALSRSLSLSMQGNKSYNFQILSFLILYKKDKLCDYHGGTTFYLSYYSFSFNHYFYSETFFSSNW
jgi:hypothetical protein